MKRFTRVLLSLLIVISLTACQTNANTPNSGINDSKEVVEKEDNENVDNNSNEENSENNEEVENEVEQSSNQVAVKYVARGSYYLPQQPIGDFEHTEEEYVKWFNQCVDWQGGVNLKRDTYTSLKEIIDDNAYFNDTGAGGSSGWIDVYNDKDQIIQRHFCLYRFARDNEKVIGTLTVHVDELNIRNLPSTSSKIMGTAINNDRKEYGSGDFVQENRGRTYVVYDITEAEGYTWYQISNDGWVADNGEWVKYIPNE